MTTAADLSPAQKEIYDLVQAGGTPETIARKLGKELWIVNAQITRMRTKGVLPPRRPLQASPTHERATSTGPTSNEAVAMQLNKAGTAQYEIPPELKSIAEKHGEVLDVHPMILLGVTIQFVKLCGGRMHAHQVIEDVYGALRTLVSDATPDKPGVTMPYCYVFSTTESESQKSEANARIKALEEQLANLKSSIR